MKIKTKENKPTQEGDTRVVRKFLLLPLKLGREIRWLESAMVYQEVIRFIDMSFGYTELRWEDRLFYDCYDCLECEFGEQCYDLNFK